MASIKAFAADVHAGKIEPPRAAKFTQVLSIGIGGSALGPQFVADALSQPSRDRMSLHFIDNTDPDGMARVLSTLEGKLGSPAGRRGGQEGGGGCTGVAKQDRRRPLVFPANR